MSSSTTPTNITAHGSSQLVSQGQSAEIKFQSPSALRPHLLPALEALSIVTTTSSNLIETRPRTSTLQQSTRLVMPKPSVAAGLQVSLETAVSAANSDLGSVVQLGDSLTSAQVAVDSSQNQVAALASKIFLPSTPVIMAPSEATRILTNPQNIFSVIYKSNGDATTPQFVLTNAAKQQVHQSFVNQDASPKILANLLTIQQYQQLQLHKQLEAECNTSQTPKVSNDKNETKILTPKLSEDDKRLLICKDILKSVVKKVEKKEKIFQQKQLVQKRKESAVKKNTRAHAAKLRALLAKHAALWRNEILRKKFLMEKEIEAMILMDKKMLNNSCSPSIYKCSPYRKYCSPSSKWRQTVIKERLEQKSELSGLPNTKRRVALKKIESLKTESGASRIGVKSLNNKKTTTSKKFKPLSNCRLYINGYKNCICSCPHRDCSALSSNDLAPCFDADDYEKLLEVIKYLDEHSHEDKFVAAEKYYTLKLRSLVRSQQMLARKLINAVLVEAEKGNLNDSVNLSHDVREEQELNESYYQTHVGQNVSHNTFAEEKQAENNLQQTERGYLCPRKNKIFNKIQENLLKCMKQDHLMEPYAPRLRSLSNDQYSFADQLINEIIFEADFGRLKCSSKVQSIGVRRR